MKIIEPSFHILDELDSSSVAVRLEACGRVCYKSEDKITDDSAIPFVTKIAAHGHNSVLEMAVLTFRVICHPQQLQALLSCQPKYLVIDTLPDGLLITGSMRAFREFYFLYSGNQLVNDLILCLAGIVPYLFENIFDQHTITARDTSVKITKMNISEVDQLPEELRLRHRFVGIRFIVNRAVTHELVRHRPCSFLQESQRYCRYSEDKFDNQVTFIRPMFFIEGSKEYQLWKEAMKLAESAYFKLLETATPQAARTVLPNSCKTEIIVFCNLLEWKHIFSLRTTPAAEPSMREIMIPLQKVMHDKYLI
ncbi:MAG: FAD-dependent thymidylate synthase [Proteobacteria bacterium]|nr:FAD-dependent thymidylate synthase [Pseudomonadota bacterium]